MGEVYPDLMGSGLPKAVKKITKVQGSQVQG
jgi:hypothetical protein